MPYHFPRCQIVPLADHQVSLQIDQVERVRWHFGPSYPRPFFFPLVGPSGAPLTRMGHPGAPNHDHHRSIWFGHAKVLGIDFWSDNTTARIRQQHWLAYADGDDEAVMAVELGWYDGHEPAALLVQELVAAVRPGPSGETLLELQSRFRPTAASLELGQTNFGMLAVRVAKSLSAHFGGGALTNSERAKDEAAIFGRPARWVDYSGPIQPPPDAAATKGETFEGITYFDHPSNPGHPAKWHVREDGWMGASLSIDAPRVLRRDEPLLVRYLLHAHRGRVVASEANAVAEEFARRGPFVVAKTTVKHEQFSVRRKQE